MKEWVKMPSAWLSKDEMPLPNLKWIGNYKSDYIAALMVYLCVTHHANNQPTAEFSETGFCRLTYDALGKVCGISRSKISNGIAILSDINLTVTYRDGRSNVYQVKDHSCKGGWAKLPARGLYDKDLSHIKAFYDFKLRTRVELDALKIYLLLAGFRDNSINYAVLAYDKIGNYTGIPRNKIRSALSFLVAHELINVDRASTNSGEFGALNMYRLCHLDVRKRMRPDQAYASLLASRDIFSE